jgi:UDP-N-acetylmuramoylalanine--D-glutamate ligase
MADWLQTQPAQLIHISAETFPMPPARALPGAHNAQNTAAATALARALGVPDSAISAGIASYPGLPHRQAEIAVIDGIHCINDSKATNADAASRAMSCYDRFIWIAGGIGKQGGIEPLAHLFPRIAHAFLIGRDGPDFAATLARHGVSHDIAGTLESAVPAALATARATQTETLLFSPAAASFDQFPNFEARGERFTHLVRGPK